MAFYPRQITMHRQRRIDKKVIVMYILSFSLGVHMPCVKKRET